MKEDMHSQSTASTTLAMRYRFAGYARLNINSVSRSLNIAEAFVLKLLTSMSITAMICSQIAERVEHLDLNQ